LSPDFEPLVPAAAAFDAKGILYSPRFGDVYASSEGALAQASHVFLKGNGLPERWHKVQSFTIIETGFGAGFNFLATWLAWRSTGSPARLHFISVEKHPFDRAALEQAHAHHPAVTEIAGLLRGEYPPLLPGFHRLHFDDGRVTLTLLFGDAASMLRQLQAKADAFFLDGFAPAKNPQMWSKELFTQLTRLADANATLASYTVASSVCAGLSDAGFAVEKRPGFGHKRDMLCGRNSRRVGKPPVRYEQHAIIIGAGLAGTSCAQRLAERGWRLDLIERNDGPAQEGSGNPAGLVRPVFSADWNTHSRFTTSAYLYAIRHQAMLERDGQRLSRGEGGVLQLARDAIHFDKQQRIIEQFSLRPDLVKVLQVREATELAGATLAGPACWFPSAVWADPASMCRANLGASGESIHHQYGRSVHALRRIDGGWEALDSQHGILARAPVVVLANANAASQLSQAAWLPLRPVRGQVSLLPSQAGKNLRIAVCKDGYITPSIDGTHCLGSSFNEDMPDPGLRVEDHEANLRRLEAMLPGFASGMSPAMLDGRVAFRAMSHDRLPILGELAEKQGESTGLFACLALGSRGMTWAALAAEIIASRITGEPMPVERNLLKVLDPLRFRRKKF
jgi:tRNA 5-methylaminomethyl-2-thiouridine biosynthesis bifunctional protein